MNPSSGPACAPREEPYAALADLGGGSSVPNILSQKRLVMPKPFS